jgi:hypothetical protein
LIAEVSVAMSETLLASRDWARSWAGLRVSTTTTARMAMIAMTTRSSMRVKAERGFFERKIILEFSNGDIDSIR